MKKKTLNDRIRALKIKKMHPVMNGVFDILAKILYYNQCKVDVTYHVDPNEYRDKPVIVVANHASRMDYAFVKYAMKGRSVNFVAAENEFHRSHLQLVFKLGKVIPKKNFVPDLKTIKGMTEILRHQKNGCVCIFPCGMSTASGAQQPSMLGSGKMLKRFGVHVLCVNIHGGYFVSPKFDVKERYGKVEVEISELFNPEQLAELDEATINQKLDEALFTDDYEWNKTRQHSYKCKWGYAKNLHQLLYKCPACGEEMQMLGEGNTIKCLKCGNGATLDDKYNLVALPGSTVPENPRVWFDNERRDMHKKVQDPNFVLEEHVQIGVMHPYKYMKNKKVAHIVGDGTLRLDHTGVTYTGTRDGSPRQVHIPREAIVTICLPVDASFFYTYASGEFLQFVPDTASSLRWLFAVEEMYRTHGGLWQNYPWFNYD